MMAQRLDDRGPRRGALAIAALHLLLTLLYGITVPLWEGYDEWAHFTYVEHVARQRALPDPSQRLMDEYEYDQASQPPLYYIVAALAVWPVNTADGVRAQPNPYATRADGAGGVNMAVHDPAVEGFPWRGTVLAAHLARIVSALISTLALWPTYALARALAPTRPALALGALAMQAFLPQYVYTGSIINNDILVTALCGATLYFAVRVALHTARPVWLGGMALALGLAVWTKLNGLALAPVAALALALAAARHIRRPRAARPVLLAAAALVVLGLLLALWLRRNLAVMDAWIPRGAYALEILYWMLRVPELTATLQWHALRPGLEHAFVTFWASFGWGNVETFAWFYPLCTLLTLAALAGVGLQLAAPRAGYPRRLAVCVLLAAVGSVVGLSVYRELVFGVGDLPGRYLLPALPAVSILFIVGVARLVPDGREWPSLAALGGVFGVVSLLALFLHIRPAYLPPAPIAPEALPATAQPLRARFGDVAELVAYEMRPADVQPGQGVGLRLYWRALAAADRNYTLAVHVLGPDMQTLGSLNIYPGRGNYATTLWQPGTLFAEDVYITVSRAESLPALGRLSVALFMDDGSGDRLAVADAEGNPLGGSVIFGQLRLSPAAGEEPAPPPLPAPPLDIRFGPDANIRLRGADLWPHGFAPIDATLTLTLTWESGQPLADGQAYSVFVHLLDGAGNAVRQADAPPGGERLPTTIWRAGDWVTGVHTLSTRGLPPGDYRVALGLYAADGTRLAARAADGSPLDADRVLLPPLYVAGRAASIHVPLALVGE